MLRFSFLIIALITSNIANAEHPSSFRSAKKTLKKIYQDNPVSFYCGCNYALKDKPNKKGKRLTPDFTSCGYSHRKNLNRASRIEWEHVMPAHHFGHLRQCWQKGGRRTCKKDPFFRKMEADMHNLVPAIGEVNGDRSNFKFGMIEGEPRRYGACDVEINFKARRVEPAPPIRGDIARIYFYMRDTYQLKLSPQQTKLFEAWSKSDPVDDGERLKNRRVQSIQGNANPYVR